MHKKTALHSSLNAMDDGCDFILSQFSDTVETEVMVENSVENLTISQSVDKYFGDEVPTHMDLYI
jgi:hypothetical protein